MTERDLEHGWQLTGTSADPAAGDDGCGELMRVGQDQNSST
jgi:hypothetical protein